MTNEKNKKLNSAIIFLEKYATDEYDIQQNQIIYNRNLKIPDVPGISNMDLSAIDVKGLVMVCTSEKLDFEKLPKAELYWGLGVDNIYFNPKAKISRKQIEQKGFNRKISREYSRRQFLSFISSIPAKLGLGK